jgi:hypothetical protein
MHDRNIDPMHKRRRQVIQGSAMYADATAIGVMAKKLESAIDAFLDEYTRDTAFDLFVAAKCHVPEDISEESSDSNLDWSHNVYSDVSGFLWALEMFGSMLSANVYISDEVKVVDQEGEDVEPAVVVVS